MILLIFLLKICWKRKNQLGKNGVKKGQKGFVYRYQRGLRVGIQIKMVLLTLFDFFLTTFILAHLTRLRVKL